MKSITYYRLITVFNQLVRNRSRENNHDIKRQNISTIHTHIIYNPDVLIISTYTATDRITQPWIRQKLSYTVCFQLDSLRNVTLRQIKSAQLHLQLSGNTCILSTSRLNLLFESHKSI